MEHFIKNIEILNFKSIRHAEIKDCRRVNVFVGPPNVGKSNILEALSGFSFTALSNEVNLKELMRFRDISDLFYNGGTAEFSEVCFDDELYLGFHFKSQNSVTIGISDRSLKNQDKINTLNSPSYYSSRYTGGNHETKLLESVIEGVSQFELDKYQHQLPEVKKYHYKEEVQYLASQNNSLVIPFGNNISDIIETNQGLRNEIVSYFKPYNQKLLFDKSKKELRIVKFLNDDTVFSVSIDLVADTLKRLIFYKAAILSNENTVLLFEEPEAHCYEPYILEFTNTVKRDQNNNQFFIVTHSQYVIEELLRDEGSRNDTNIYMVGLENNETKVKLLSQEMNKEIYQTGLNVFFNYESLWNEIKEHEAVH